MARDSEFDALQDMQEMEREALCREQMAYDKGVIDGLTLAMEYMRMDLRQARRLCHLRICEIAKAGEESGNGS